MNKKDKTGKKQEQRRKRAIIAVLVLVAAGIVLRFEGKSWFYIPWIAGIYFLFGILVHPAILSPVDSLVQKVTMGLAWIVSHSVLLFLFLFVITPLGLWFRLRGRDRLNLKFPGDEDSFWRRRSPEEQIPKCDKQF